MKEGWNYSSIGDLCDKMNGLWKGKIGPFVNVGVIRNANFNHSPLVLTTLNILMLKKNNTKRENS